MTRGQSHLLAVDHRLNAIAWVNPAEARAWRRAGRAVPVASRGRWVLKVKDAELLALLRRRAAATAVGVGDDPGSRWSGLAVIVTDGGSGQRTVVCGAELEHDATMPLRIARRAMQRKARRSRNHDRRVSAARRACIASRERFTRDRRLGTRKPSRGKDRTYPKGWIAPSMRARLENSVSTLRKLGVDVDASGEGIAGVTVSVEVASFDTHAMRDPGVYGVGYQEGPLYRANLKTALAHRDGWRCAYCGAENVSLECEHVLARSRGGGDGPANRVLACKGCNDAKGSRPLEAWAAERFGPEACEVVARVRAALGASLRHAAATNVLGTLLVKTLRERGVDVRTACASDARVQRERLGVGKSHWVDAACATLGWSQAPLAWAVGSPYYLHNVRRSSRQRVQNDEFGQQMFKAKPGVPVPKKGPDGKRPKLKPVDRVIVRMNRSGPPDKLQVGDCVHWKNRRGQGVGWIRRSRHDGRCEIETKGGERVNAMRRNIQRIVRVRGVVWKKTPPEREQSECAE